MMRADLQSPQALDALVDAILARRLREIAFNYCSPAAPAPLARLLRGGELKSLSVRGLDVQPFLDSAGAALVADALHANTTLTCLHVSVPLCRDTAAACTLLGGLEAHQSLRELRVSTRNDAGLAAFGAAVAAIIAADSPVLQSLSVAYVSLYDAGLAPIVAALPHNHHLRDLDLSRTGPSDAFLRNTLLPAVRANTSLRYLGLFGSMAEHPAALEAVVLVHSRTQEQ